MTIRDRGKLKWQPASFLPLGFEMDQEMYKDQSRQPKPILDEQEAEEFNLRIIYAMEYNHSIKITIWNEGFTNDIIGQIHYVDPITHELRIELNTGGEFEKIALESIVRVRVVD